LFSEHSRKIDMFLFLSQHEEVLVTIMLKFLFL